MVGLGHDTGEIDPPAFDAREAAIPAAEEVDAHASRHRGRSGVLATPREKTSMAAVEPTVECTVECIPAAPRPDHRARFRPFVPRSVAKADAPLGSFLLDVAHPRAEPKPGSQLRSAARQKIVEDQAGDPQRRRGQAKRDRPAVSEKELTLMDALR